MHTVLLAIEESLGMERGVLERTIGPQMELPEQNPRVVDEDVSI